MLAAVFVLIAVRQVGRFSLKIWQIMLGGAMAVLVTGQISLPDAVSAVNPDVMIFLFGMFVVGEALVQSGYLAQVADRFFFRMYDPHRVVLAVLFSMGLLSAILMNDTIAIIGTPLVLGLAARNHLPPKLMLLSLAFAITTGSVASPIGNPQNLLIAINSGTNSPFVTFGLYLFLPTIISLCCAYIILRLVFRSELGTGTVPVPSEGRGIHDEKLAFLARASLIIILVSAAANIAASLAAGKMIIPLALIALFAATPILVFSGQRFIIMKKIDWSTLVFFAAMFVLMESVWQTGFFQSLTAAGGELSSVPVIIGTSVVISQFISNVPFVALFQPLIMDAGGSTTQLMALAAGSTIAGNLTILGAASNVIIIQNAEKQGQTLTFFEFAKAGVPLTIMQAGIFWAFLAVS